MFLYNFKKQTFYVVKIFLMFFKFFIFDVFVLFNVLFFVLVKS